MGLRARFFELPATDSLISVGRRWEACIGRPGRGPASICSAGLVRAGSGVGLALACTEGVMARAAEEGCHAAEGTLNATISGDRTQSRRLAVQAGYTRSDFRSITRVCRITDGAYNVTPNPGRILMASPIGRFTRTGLPRSPLMRRPAPRYWASQRSLRNPGPCSRRGHAESDRRMEAGCHEAQRRLAPTDARRLSEPDYRLGWNAFPEAPQAASQPNSAFLPGAMWTIPGATTAQPPTSPFPATPLVQPAEAIASSRQLPPPAPVAVDPTPHSVSSSEPMPANVSAFKPASMRQCAAGVPPPLSAVPPAKQSSRPAAQAACPSASGLADRFGALQRSAAPAQQVVERETVRVRELQKQMNDIGDRCPEEFRCANIAGLTNLQSLNFASLSQEANDINRCAGVLLRNLIDAPSQPSNIQTLFDQLQHIEEGSMALSGDLAVATRLAERRMSGFDANLRQCRDSTKTP